MKALNDVILGRFVIERIWRASNLVYLVAEKGDRSRKYIAKRMLPEAVADQFLNDWFSREADITGKLDGHPHLVSLKRPITSDATDPEHPNYFLLEYVDGGTLLEILHAVTEGRLSIPQTMRWAVQIASAMHHASVAEKNRWGVFLHRDLDPKNVMISRTGIAKVADWSVGKKLDEPDEDVIHTRTVADWKDGIIGKAPYMAPEQFPPARGRGYCVAGDVYYFGGLLVSMLLGVPLNPEADSKRLLLGIGPEVSQDDVREVLRRHQHSTIMPALAARSCPEQLMQLVRDCIEVDFEHRIGSFAAILGRLAELAPLVSSWSERESLLACPRCGFVGMTAQTCPVCRLPDRFQPFKASEFHLGIDLAGLGDDTRDKLGRPPGVQRADDDGAHRPDSSSLDAASPGSGRTASSTRETAEPRAAGFGSRTAPRRNSMVEIPAGRCVLGAREDVVRRIASEYDLDETGRQLFAQPVPCAWRNPGYSISRWVVSNEEYLEFLDATGWRKPEHFEGTYEPRLPVVNVDFQDAEAFCQWKGVRLPTDAEWERAARGSKGWVYPWGDEKPGARPPFRCNTLERSQMTGETLVAVDSFSEHASPEGVVGAIGNVWEWVDGGSGSFKHTRGGCFRSQVGTYALSWVRLKTNPQIRDGETGFRYASGPEPEPPMDPQALDELVPLAEGKYRLGLDEREREQVARLHSLPEDTVRTLANNQARVVSLRAVRIRKHLVTNEEYFDFVRATDRSYPEHWTPALEKWSPRPFLERYRHHPVVNVSLADAREFCSWKGGRLPTSDEWEAAARGPSGSYYPWGDSFDVTRCNVAESKLGRTSRVGLFPDGASACGCLDMAGNVWEWVEPSNRGPHQVRGGSFEDTGAEHTLAFRPIKASPAYRGWEVGFRYVAR